MCTKKERRWKDKRTALEGRKNAVRKNRSPKEQVFSCAHKKKNDVRKTKERRSKYERTAFEGKKERGSKERFFSCVRVCSEEHCLRSPVAHEKFRNFLRALYRRLASSPFRSCIRCSLKKKYNVRCPFRDEERNCSRWRACNRRSTFGEQSPPVRRRRPVVPARVRRKKP